VTELLSGITSLALGLSFLYVWWFLLRRRYVLLIAGGRLAQVPQVICLGFLAQHPDAVMLQVLAALFGALRTVCVVGGCYDFVRRRLPVWPLVASLAALTLATVVPPLVTVDLGLQRAPAIALRAALFGWIAWVLFTGPALQGRRALAGVFVLTLINQLVLFFTGNEARGVDAFSTFTATLLSVILLIVVLDEARDEAERAEYARKDSERRRQTIFERAPIGIAVVDAAGRYVEVNPAFQKMLGYDPRDLVGRHFRDVTLPADLALTERLFGEMLTGARDHFFLEKRYVKQDGTAAWARLSVSAVRDASGALLHTVSMIEDVSERKQLEEQLVHAQKLEALGSLAGGVAHDFNNLLAAMMGYTQLIQRSLPGDDARQNDLVEIRRAGDRAAALSRQLLAFARRQVIDPRILDVNDVLRAAEAMLRRLVGGDITVVLQLAPTLAPVRVDPGQLEQVILNLAVNAHDAMPAGGTLTIETSGVVLDEAYGRLHPDATPGAHVLIAVRDTGVGMTPEVRNRIFEPFFTTKEPGKGTGLGLATCYGIVKQAGGSIWVQSEPGRGATFKVYLPARPEAAARATPPATEAPLPGGSETIMVVEDEPTVRSVTVRMLASAGYRVLAASDGPEALAAARGHAGEIHALVTDVVMPKMHGTKLAALLRADRPGLRTLFVSGYTEDAGVRPDQLAKGMGYLAKPFTAEALTERLRQVLDA
jgi:PAS domain S-box-containing protein